MHTTSTRFCAPPSRRPEPATKQTKAFPPNRWCQECGCGVYRRPGRNTVYLNAETARVLKRCPECGEALRTRLTPFPEYPEHRLQDEARGRIEVQIGSLVLLTRVLTVDVTNHDRGSLPEVMRISVEGLPVRLDFSHCYRADRDWFAVYDVEEA